MQWKIITYEPPQAHHPLLKKLGRGSNTSLPEFFQTKVVQTKGADVTQSSDPAALYSASDKVRLVARAKGVHVFTFPFVIEAPARVTWTFEVEQHDIEFFVLLVTAKPAATKMLLQKVKYIAGPSYSGHVSVGLEGPCQVELCWTNAYSFLQEKVVRYSVQMHPIDGVVTAQLIGVTSAEARDGATVVRTLASAAAVISVEQLDESDVTTVLFHPPCSYLDADDGSISAKKRILSTLASSSTSVSIKQFSRPLWQLKQVRHPLFSPLSPLYNSIL